MADIRINALATTATTPASDDYLALDGSANGTRKILATNIANNVTDVILGSSGPSVKSTLSARAPRQGLVFDGTAGATVASVAAFSTSDFTVSAWINPTIGAAALAIVGSQTNGFVFSVLTDGTLRTAKENVVNNTASTGAVSSGKNALVTYTRSGTTGTYYINGVSAGTTTDSNDYSVAITQIGSNGASAANKWTGSLSVTAYNRALSSSEVVALYEAGAPADYDYQASMGNPISGTTPSAYFDNGATGSITASTATSFTANYTGGSTVDYRPAFTYAGTNTVKKGSLWRIKFTTTVNSGSPVMRSYGDAPWANTTGGTVVSGTSPAGTTFSGTQNWDYIVQSGATTTNLPIQFTFNGQANGGANWNITVSNISVTPLGLLLAPDAYQAGGGLAWYDTSGNSATITLPASGVSWNVPSSQKTASGWTFGGNVLLGSIASGVSTTTPLTLSLGGTYGTTVSNGIKLPIYEGGGIRHGLGAIAGNLYLATTDNTTVMSFATDSTERARFTSGGNLLLGNTVNATGLLQLGTTGSTTSAGGIGFGTDTFLYRGGAGIGTLELSASSGTVSILKFALAGTTKAQIGIAAGASYIDYDGSLIVRNGIGGTTALTLDSSQNATFAKRVNINGLVQITPSAGVDTYFGYGATYDSFITAASTGAHYLRDSTGDVWWTFDKNKTFIANTGSAPAANPTGGGFLYVQGGALKYRGSSGTVTTIANA